MARFGIEIDVNTRGVTAEVDRTVAHINRALSQLASSGKGATANTRGRRDIEVEGASRIQQLQQQGAPASEIARVASEVSAALKDFDKAVRTNTQAQRAEAAAARTRLESKGADARTLERQAVSARDKQKVSTDPAAVAQDKRDRYNAQVQGRLAVQQDRKANVGGIMDLEIEEARLRAENNAFRKEQNRLQRQQAAQQAAGPATGYQRLQAYLHQRGNPDSGRIAQDFPRLGQATAQRAITTAQFAASGAALYAVVNGLQAAVRAAEELQRVMITIKSQFDSIGDGDQFEGFRADMLDLARESGVAADVVATVGFQMKGVYGDTATAVRETEAAIRASVVTGIEQKELTDSLTAASLAYGVSIEEITDKAIGLEERFGVLARESLKVFGDMATVATQAGLDIGELGALIGSIQQASALPGSAIAEGMSRIIPAIQGQSAEILRLYQQTPQLSANLPDVAGAISEGRQGDVLIQLIRDFDSLDKSAQNYVTTLLGGRREARFLNALFGDTSKVLREIDGDFDDTGKTAKRFADIQTTLRQTIARIREQLLQIGDSLARAGIFDALIAMGGAIEVGVSALGGLVRAFAWLNEHLGGAPGKLLAVAVALKSVAVAVNAVTKARAALIAINALGTLAAGGVPTAGAGALTGGVAGGRGLLGAIGGAGGAAQIVGDIIPSRRTGPMAAGRGYLRGIGTLGGRSIGGGGFGLGATGGAWAGAATLGLGAANVAAWQLALGDRVSGINIPGTDRPLFAGFGALQNDNDAANTITRDNLKNKRLSALLDLRSSGIMGTERSGFMNSGTNAEAVGAFLTGNKTDYEILQEQIEEETLASYRQAMENGILDDKDPANKRRLAALERSDGGGKSGELAAQQLSELGKEDAKALRDLQDKRNNIEEIIASGGAQLRLNASQASAAFQAGEIGYAEYIAVLEETASGLEQITTSEPELQAAITEARRQANAAASRALVAEVEFYQQILQGTGQDPALALQKVIDALGSPELTAADRSTMISTYTSLQQGALQKAIANAPTAEEALRLSEEGLVIDPQVAHAMEQHQIATAGYVYQEMDGQVIKAGEDATKAARQRVIAAAQLRLQHANRNVQDPVALADVEVQIAQKQLEGAITEEEILAAEIAVDEAKRAARDARRDVAQARLSRLNNARDDDPMEDARRTLRDAENELARAKREQLGDAAVDAAQEAVDTAKRSVRDVERDRVDARRELARARIEEDPILAAQAAIEDADLQMARAGADEAAKARALAARLRADRGLRDAMREVADAQVELMITLAEINGDVIGAAELGVRQAQTELDRRLADVAAAGGNPDLDAETIRLRGRLAQAQDVEGDTRLQEAEAEIDFMLQMEQIATDQAIARFQGLLALADDPKETQRLLLRIKQLQDQAGQDFTVNLDNMSLPSMYEIRRFGPGGGGATENRVEVVMHNYNAQDYEASIARVAQDLGGPSRYATEPTSY